MAILLRYQCSQCNAKRDGSDGEAWVRCSYCKALIGFDWLTWFESAEYKHFLANAAKNAPEFAKYPVLVAEADKRWAKKDEAGTRAKLREAAELQFRNNPFMYPREAQADAAYRDRLLGHLTEFLYLQRADAELGRLQKAFEATLAKFDMRDPMATLDVAAGQLEVIHARFVAVFGVDDPDGLPPKARLKVWMAQFLGAYLQLLSGEDRVKVLRRIYGKDAVVDTGAAAADDTHLFMEALCARCGLNFLQARGSDEFTCPGCLARRTPPKQELPAVSLKCNNCGAPEVTLGAGVIEARCEYCSAIVRRVARTGEAERSVFAEMKAAIFKQHDVALEAATDEGVGGVAVSDSNRREVVLTGLMRIAHWYASMIDARRYAKLVRGSLPGVTDPERMAALGEVLQRCAKENTGPAAMQLVGQAMTELATPR